MTRALRAVLAVAACGSIALGAGGCAASGGAGPSPTTSGTLVTVTEKEFSIELSQTTFTAGTYTFEVTDEGTFSHNLNIKGPGISDASTQNLGIGQSADLTVVLAPGTYELWCSIDSHREKGMDVTITVT